jgi:PAS domain S-box-containing protein
LDHATWRVLLIEDDEEDAFLTRQMLSEARRVKIHLEWTPTAEAGLAALRERAFDAVLVDNQLGADSGVELIRRCASEKCQAPLILLTGQGSYDVDLEAMQAGAADYLPKQEMNPVLLERAIRYAIEHQRTAAELRQHEAILARERELLQILFDRIPVMITMYRPDLEMMQFNRAFERLTGWTTTDAHEPGADLMARFYPDPAYRAEVAAFMSSLEEGWRDFEVTTRSGERLASRWSNIRLTDHTQIGIGIDIRDQLRAEQALRDSEERFRLASQAVAGVVYDWDLAANRIQRTEGLERVTGIRPEDAPETLDWWLEQVHAEDRARILPAYQGLLAGASEPSGLEYRVRHADGRWVYVWDRSLVVRDAQGRAARVVGTIADITARKELDLALARANAGLMKANRELSLANLALRDSEGRFSIALEKAPVTVFTQDRELRYTWIYNPFRGLAVDQVLGRRDDQIFPAQAAGELLAAKQAVLQNGERTQCEVTAQLEGQSITYLLTLEPLTDESGAVSGLRGAGVDLTELRRLEAERQERAAQMELHHRLLEQREMERQRIARDLHDGPIQDLLGMLFAIHAVQVDQHGLESGPSQPTGSDDWSIHPAPDPASTARLRQLEAALQATRENIQRMVGDLRVLCNELRPPALVQLGLEQAIRSHAEALHLKHPALKIHLDLPRVGRLLPDPLRLALYRIYQEGMNNVIRHSQAGEVFVRLAVSEREAALEIIDDGEGFSLPADWLELAREGHLGLVGMKERAEAADGSFSVSSQPGRGTRVRVSVPL